MAPTNGLSIRTSPKAEYLKITYTDPAYKKNDLAVHYKLRSHAVVDKWTERLICAQSKYVIDDPKRFYGFGSLQQQLDNYKIELESCIRTINQTEKIIERNLIWPLCQDYLNYLHHIFEIYHGLLDRQNNDFYKSSGPEVKDALAKLNILVHKGESLIRGPKPRHVVTYFGLPKTKTLELEDYAFFTDQYSFGTVYINYVEIGKTLEDLAVDNDIYIEEDAFKPFRFYSADFAVLFFESDIAHVQTKRQAMAEFYEKNKSFFVKKSLPIDHPHLRPGKIPIADIDSHGQELLQLLESRQYVKSVELI